MYEYYATVVYVYDGDTFHADVDLGFRAHMKKLKFRMYGINTPELRGGTEETKEAARAARDRLKELVLGKQVKLYTHKDTTGKYGRWLATVHVPINDGDFNHCQNVNALLVVEGHAVEAKY
jgi:micrococcal nuclease